MRTSAAAETPFGAKTDIRRPAEQERRCWLCLLYTSDAADE